MLSVMHYTMIQCCPFTVVYVNKTLSGTVFLCLWWA